MNIDEADLAEARRAGREARRGGMRRDQNPYFQIMHGTSDQLDRAATLAGEWLAAWKAAA